MGVGLGEDVRVYVAGVGKCGQLGRAMQRYIRQLSGTTAREGVSLAESRPQKQKEALSNLAIHAIWSQIIGDRWSRIEDGGRHEVIAGHLIGAPRWKHDRGKGKRESSKQVICTRIVCAHVWRMAYRIVEVTQYLHHTLSSPYLCCLLGPSR